MSEFWERFSRNRSAVVGLVILILVVILAFIAGFIFPEDPFRLAGKPLSGPGLNGFLLGSDSLGRDVASGIAHGAKTSLLIGLILGCIAGYYSGYPDRIIMWIINVTWSIPTLLLVIAITLALGKGFWQVFIAVGLTMWVEVARIVRGQIKQFKERQFVIAAKVMGYNDFRIITRHILPNIYSPLIVISAANFAASILIESGLSFLGLGAQPPMTSWGLMIKDHYNYIILGEPFLAIIPGVCIMLLVFKFI